jgi:hypothetical protein
VRDLNQVPLGTAFTCAAQDSNQYVGVVPNLSTVYSNAGYSFAGEDPYPTVGLA